MNSQIQLHEQEVERIHVEGFKNRDRNTYDSLGLQNNSQDQKSFAQKCFLYVLLVTLIFIALYCLYVLVSIGLTQKLKHQGPTDLGQKQSAQSEHMKAAQHHSKIQKQLNKLKQISIVPQQKEDDINIDIDQHQNNKSLVNYQYQSMSSKQKSEVRQNGGWSSKRFIVPTILWIYLRLPYEYETFINQKTIEMNKIFAYQTQFTVNFLTKQTYKNFLNNNQISQVEAILQKIKRQKYSNDDDKQTYIENVVMTYILEEHGGVFVDSYVSLLEPLSWLQNINNNIFINRGTLESDPKVVAFYSVDHSSPLIKENKTLNIEVKKYMRLFPAVEYFFIATVPKSLYITDLKQQFAKLMAQELEQIYDVAYQLQKSQAYKLTDKQALKKNLLLICSQKILVEAQKQLDQSQLAKKAFAIDYYGLKVINKYYFPYKFQYFFTKFQFEKTYMHYAKHTLKELETTVGPMRYIAVITPRQQIQFLLDKARLKKEEKYFIVKESFLHRYLFYEKGGQFIIENRENPVRNTNGPVWSSLPKKIWIFWDEGIQNSHASIQLLIRNMEIMAKKSGFKLIEVNNSNLDKYVSSSQIQRIQQILEFSRVKTHSQSRSDLIRLAILIRHGGIYMDASFIILESLSWIVNIANYPSEYIFNRYGDLPKVLMYFNPHYGCPYDEWKLDQKYNTKAHWHLSYQHNFIAAQPRSQLLFKWYEDLTNYLTQPYSYAEEEFKLCGISQHKWSKAEDTSLLSMDAVKCVIGKKKNELQNNGNYLTSASQYYGVWSMSSFNGPQKFGSSTNFQNPNSNDHLFLRRYSEFYVQQVIGEPKHLINLYSYGNKQLNKFIQQKYNRKLSKQIHHKSFFNHYLLSRKDTDQKFIIQDDKVLIKEEDSEA